MMRTEPMTIREVWRAQGTRGTWVPHWHLAPSGLPWAVLLLPVPLPATDWYNLYKYFYCKLYPHLLIHVLVCAFLIVLVPVYLPVYLPESAALGPPSSPLAPRADCAGQRPTYFLHYHPPLLSSSSSSSFPLQTISWYYVDDMDFELKIRCGMVHSTFWPYI